MNKVMITGANRGLGYELVKVFYHAGDEVFAVVRNARSAEKLKQEFPERIYPIVADVGLDVSESIVRTSLHHETDHLDILINNAGNPNYEHQIQKSSTTDILDLLNVHCLGAIRMVKATLDFLNKSRHARIINVSSRLGSLQMMVNDEFRHLQNSYAYSIAKAAQNMFTICLGKELAESGIIVQAIHPGKLKTELANTDADMEVSTGANNIYQWLVNLPEDTPVKFVQPGVSDLIC